MLRLEHPRTASELLTAVSNFGPAVEGFDLVFETDPPDEYDGMLRILQTGIRAILTGRRWFGISTETGRGWDHDPRFQLPDWVGMLLVEGDPRWDRLRPDARLDFPHLFRSERPPRAGELRRGPASIAHGRH